MKRFLRKAARFSRQWLFQDGSDTLAGTMLNERQRFPKFAYGELNARLLEIMHRRGDDVRANYVWGVLHAAHLARALGIKRISVCEFGVAGGRGLVALENAAEEAEKAYGVAIDVYGFDTGRGLPKPEDYRDLPNVYTESTYKMDEQALRGRLRRAKLIIGLIADTLPGFLASNPAPVGFFAIDVDLYSSTVDILQILRADQKLLLPRIHCYADDTTGFTFAEFNGERLAIKEFSDANPMRKLSPIHGLKYFVPERMMHDQWVDAIYLAHILDHDLYAKDDGLVLVKDEAL